MASVDEVPAAERARQMRELSDKDRLLAITWGVLAGNVIDARPRLRSIASHFPADTVGDCA